jgi:hypothetical protein
MHDLVHLDYYTNWYGRNVSPLIQGYTMFNGFLPRFIAEKGILTGQDSIADTYRQCKFTLKSWLI